LDLVSASNKISYQSWSKVGYRCFFFLVRNESHAIVKENGIENWTDRMEEMDEGRWVEKGVVEEVA
jgi:hypothetical protein